MTGTLDPRLGAGETVGLTPDVRRRVVEAVDPPPSRQPRPMDTDLFDRVIQRIFMAGVVLRGASNMATAPIAACIEQAVGELDDALHDIRTTVLAVAKAERCDLSDSATPPGRLPLRRR